MKLDCLLNVEQSQTIVRLYAFTAAEASTLADAFKDLAGERKSQFDVHAMPEVSVIGECRLTLQVTNHDQSLVEVGPFKFNCGFTAGTWDNIAGLVEPFCSKVSGFQWLAGSPGEALLLLSANGDW